jgi:hypothetical protein
MPRTDVTFGPWLKTRLTDEDWIKSLDLFNFTKPLDVDPEPLWKPEPETVAHIEKQLAKFPREATSLDALEHNLEAFARHSVKGIDNWFDEIGREAGYWLDKRIHSVAWEMAAIASMCEWSQVSKLRRSNKVGVPDYQIDLGSIILVAEAKTIFGRAWPLVVLRTMMRALIRVGGMTNAQEVMIVAENPNITTLEIERQIGDIKVDTLIRAINEIVQTGREVLLTPGLVAVPRTEAARTLKLHATYLRIEAAADFDDEFAIWMPSLEAIKNESVNAWEQCVKWEGVPSGAMRLEVAAIAAEAWPGHPDLSSNQLLLREWLRDEIWPSHPNRALMAKFGDILDPVWFVSPWAMREMEQAREKTTGSEG